jgi:hypothetical protein
MSLARFTLPALVLCTVLTPCTSFAARIGDFCSVTDRNQIFAGHEKASLRPAPLSNLGREVFCAFTTRNTNPGLETIREIWTQRLRCSDDVIALNIDPITLRSPLLVDPLGKWSYTDPAWSPNGRFLAYARTDAFVTSSSIWVQEFVANSPTARSGDPILVLDGVRENYRGVWGSSPTDVFTVGSDGRILHYDGSNWRRMPNGISADLQTVWGTSGIDVFAAGEAGTILHYDGISWTPMVSPTTARIDDIWGFGPNDVYAAGGATLNNDNNIFHYDGSTWTRAPGGGDHFGLAAIWGTSGTNLFGVGSGNSCPPNPGAIVHYDGNRRCPMIGKVDCYLTFCANEPSCHVIAPTPPGCPQVQGMSPRLYDVWGRAADDIFAIGTEGTILNYDGALWNSMISPTSSTLYAVWGTPARQVFAVGAGGTILHFSAGTWSQVGSPTTADLFGVWGSSASDVFAVGAGGDPSRTLIIHYDGISWSTVLNSTHIISTNLRPTWDPTGKILAFDSDRTGTSLDIWTAQVFPSVGAPVQFTSVANKAEQAPSWSPDGAKIAYATNRLGPTTIEYQPFPAGAPVQAEYPSTLKFISHANPSWSRDGKSIYYDAPRCEDPNNPPDIWRLELASQTKSFANLDFAGDFDVDVSRATAVPGGDFIVFTSLTRDPNFPGTNLGVNLWAGDCAGAKGVASGQPSPNFTIGNGANLKVHLDVLLPFKVSDVVLGLQCPEPPLLEYGGSKRRAVSALISGGKIKLEFTPLDVQALLGTAVTSTYKVFQFTIEANVVGSCGPLRATFQLNVRS